MRLQDRVALITGGANGIGAACVRRFAQEGARVLFADRDAEGGAALAAKLGPAVGFIAVDVTHRPFAQTCAKAAVKRFAPLPILIINAYSHQQ